MKDRKEKSMNIIVAVDENWAIGNKGDLLVRIPNDQKMFRLETTGKVVVLGRKTLDTFPQKQPIPALPGGFRLLPFYIPFCSPSLSIVFFQNPCIVSNSFL